MQPSMLTPALRTERLHLCPYRPCDRLAFARLFQDPRVMAHVGGPLSEERTNALFARLLAGQAPFYRAWRVLRPARDAPAAEAAPPVSDHAEAIGHVALMRHEHDALELGFLVHVRHWGRGYAAEAARAVLAHARSQPDHPRILATVDPDHAASIRVLEKIGMRRERVAHDDAGAYYIYAAT